MSQSCLYQHFCQNRGEKRQYADTKSSCYSLDKNVVKLPELNVVLNKLLPLLNKAKDLNYDKSNDSFLPLMWKTHHQICIPKQSVSYPYVAWITSTFKFQDQQKTHITFLPSITQFSTAVKYIYQSQKLAES